MREALVESFLVVLDPFDDDVSLELVLADAPRAGGWIG